MLGDIATASQQTLKTAIGCRGIGLHSGERVAMTLHPAPPDSGIVFRRTGSAVEIRANWTNTIESPLSTVLSNGEGNTVGTVEHLMAALAGAAIDNAVVELDGREVPIMDGSSAPFLFLIECAGVVEQDAARRAIKVLKEVSVTEDGATAALLPDHGFSMSFEIDFDNPLIRRQDVCLVFDADTFKTELSRARTFGLLDELDRLRAAGLVRGGSLDNAVVVGRDHVLNVGGLRSGHAHTRRLLSALFADREAWCYTTLSRSAHHAEREWQDGLQLASD